MMVRSANENGRNITNNQVLFFFIIINIGIRVNLHAPRLIPRALKLMIM